MFKSITARLLSGTLALVLVPLALALAALAWAEHESNDERAREHTVLMARVFADHATRPSASDSSTSSNRSPEWRNTL